MKLSFYKYQAAGNDFVCFDNRQGEVKLTTKQIGRICDRRFGVGADGIIYVERDANYDFYVRYFNADGTQSLCGNGSRSAVDLAAHLKLVAGKTIFNAYDGPHEATVISPGLIRMQIHDVKHVERKGDDYFMNTGSPHNVRFVTGLPQYPVFEEGRKIRYSPLYNPTGTNANFVELLPDNTIAFRIYERGVEEETLSSGTGATACALAASFVGYHSPVRVQSRGGQLEVEFKRRQDGTFYDIYVTGPAKMVFQGSLEL